MARNKTGSLPGMERKAIKEIETAADEYVELRDKRIACLQKELDAKQKLVALMEKHGQKVYVFEEDGDNVTVELQPGQEKLKVKKAPVEMDAE